VSLPGPPSVDASKSGHWHGHVTGGFVGNGLICPTLTQIGRSDLAWNLVLTNTYPSWLFSVKNGATSKGGLTIHTGHGTEYSAVTSRG